MKGISQTDNNRQVITNRVLIRADRNISQNG